MTLQNLELHSKRSPYTTGKFNRAMGMNESSHDELMLTLVIKGVLHLPANSPIHVATVFYETERTRSQARALSLSSL